MIHDAEFAFDDVDAESATTMRSDEKDRMGRDAWVVLIDRKDGKRLFGTAESLGEAWARAWREALNNPNSLPRSVRRSGTTLILTCPEERIERRFRSWEKMRAEAGRIVDRKNEAHLRIEDDAGALVADHVFRPSGIGAAVRASWAPAPPQFAPSATHTSTATAAAAAARKRKNAAVKSAKATPQP